MANINWSQYKEKTPDIDWSQYREQEESSDPHNQTLSQSLKDVAKGGGVGLFQGLSDIGANIAQFPSDIYSAVTGREGYHAPKPSFRENYPQSPYGQIAGTIGEYAGPLLLPGVGAESLGSRALSKALYGAGIGAAESDSRILGGALGALGGVIPGAVNLAKNSSSKKIAETLLKDKAAIKKEYTTHYSDLFKQAAEKGIKNVSKPKINIKTIEDSGMPKYYKALQQFIKNPSLENAHWAQSGLGQLERKLNDVQERTGLTPPQNKAYKEVQNAKQKIQEAMFANHKLGSQPELAKRYSDISAGYKQNVVPWRSAKGLKDFNKGELKAKDLTSKLNANKKFMAQLGHEYPQLKLNQLSRNPWVRGIITSALGLETADQARKAFRG